MKDFYRLFPHKFNNKTNGVTPRRWLYYSNPQLTDLLKETIGEGFLTDLTKIADLKNHIENQELIDKFNEVKLERKQILVDYIKETMGIEINPHSIFDVQAKRLHAYKRQMLNCMNIIYLYRKIKSDPNFTMHPTTFLFSAKAAPSYVFAKKVIQLINTLQRIINSDPEVNKYINVVFIPNYSVSIAEILLNAANVSEQISTAGKEASGTGNMKLMMNGAITIGTLDGANVEIRECVGDENIFIFGNTVEELRVLRNTGYNAFDYYHNDPDIKRVMDSLIDGTWSTNKEEFKSIFDEIMYRNDEFFLLADFRAYVETQRKINELYQNRNEFTKMCLRNIASSAYFSSDRTIRDYNNDIWHLEEIKF